MSGVTRIICDTHILLAKEFLTGNSDTEESDEPIKISKIRYICPYNGKNIWTITFLHTTCIALRS